MASKCYLMWPWQVPLLNGVCEPTGGWYHYRKKRSFPSSPSFAEAEIWFPRGIWVVSTNKRRPRGNVSGKAEEGNTWWCCCGERERWFLMMPWQGVWGRDLTWFGVCRRLHWYGHLEDWARDGTIIWFSFVRPQSVCLPSVLVRFGYLLQLGVFKTCAIRKKEKKKEMKCCLYACNWDVKLSPHKDGSKQL